MRPKTWPAGIVPVVLGSAFAYRYGAFHAPSAAAALVGALLIQVGTNYANDYYDHKRGVDTADRLGPRRASASGLIEPRQVLAGALVAFALAALTGLYLVYRGGWPILVVGVASILAGYLYTGGPYPLGYHGWGDAFVLVFFGLVAVAGTYYVQAQGPPGHAVLIAGLALGMIATAILVVNNLRDRETDAKTGKRTLAVRLGQRGTQIEYALLVFAPFLLVAIPVLQRRVEPLFALPLLALPLAAYLAHQVWHEPRPEVLNRILAQTGLLLALFGLLWSLGVAL